MSLGQNVWEKIRTQHQMAGANVPTLKELPSMVQHQTVAPEDTGVWFSGTELAGVTRRPRAPFSAFFLTPKKDGSCHLRYSFWNGALFMSVTCPTAESFPSITGHCYEPSTRAQQKQLDGQRSVFLKTGGCMVRKFPLSFSPNKS